MFSFELLLFATKIIDFLFPNRSRKKKCDNFLLGKIFIFNNWDWFSLRKLVFRHFFPKLSQFHFMQIISRFSFLEFFFHRKLFFFQHNSMLFESIEMISLLKMFLLLQFDLDWTGISFYWSFCSLNKYRN